MWWKIYFFVLTGLTVIGLPYFLLKAAESNFVDWMGLVLNMILILAAYSIAFGKKILSAQTWKILFWINMVNAILEVAAHLDSSGSLRKTLNFILEAKVFVYSFGELIFSVLIASPAWYTMYLLSKSKK